MKHHLLNNFFEPPVPIEPFEICEKSIFVRGHEFAWIADKTYRDQYTGIILSNTGSRWFCYTEYAMAYAETAPLVLLIATTKNMNLIKLGVKALSK